MRQVGNLPRDVTSFVGRRSEVPEAKRLLSRSRLLTLTGAAGVGKTRLALRVATKLRSAFADGVWLVDLAHLDDAALLPHAVADAFDLRENPAWHAWEGLVDYLADKHLLLVLDNCEHLVTHCAILVDKLLGIAPQLRILATSRQALGVPGEQIFTVPALSVPDRSDPGSERDLKAYEALCLFVERAANIAPSFKINDDNREAVVRLCQRLDGIPLAIELAAGRLRKFTIHQILDRLDDYLQFLGAQGRTAVPHQQTLSATMDWSFDLCSSEEQALWARLSVFSGGVELAAAEDVCSGWGIAPEDVFEAVIGLVDKSILIPEACAGCMRYRLLDSVRQYGRNKLAASGQVQAMRRRHRDWYLGLTDESEKAWMAPAEMEWLTRLQCEHANLRTAVDFCLSEPGEAAGAVAISGSLAAYCVAAGRLDEGRRWADRALELAPQPTAARGKALWANGRYALLQGDVAAAMPMLVECRILAQRLHDANLAAFAKWDFALAALLCRDFGRAAAFLGEACEHFRAVGEFYGLWLTLYLLAITDSFLGDADRAVACGEECVALAEARRAGWSKSHGLWVLGALRWWQGDWRRAEALLLESLRFKREANDQWGIVLCLEALAWTAAADGRYHRAARLLGAASTLWRVVGSSPIWVTYMSASHHWCQAEMSAALGERAFAAAFRKGTEFARDHAIIFALENKKAGFHAHTAACVGRLVPNEKESSKSFRKPE
jgi:predicted ATPase